MGYEIDKTFLEEAEDTRQGIKLEKGVLLTENKVIKNFDLLQNYMNFFCTYPDLFVDLITPKSSNFKLFPYQRIFLRASIRYRYHYCTACFVAGTPILTKNGYKKIEEVEPGDEVLSHLGWRKVLFPTILPYEGGFRKIKGDKGFEQDFVCTEDHEFFINDGQWVAAKDIKNGDFLLSFVDRRFAQNRLENVENFFEILGYWISCGSENKRHFQLVFDLKDKNGREKLKNKIIKCIKEEENVYIDKDNKIIVNSVPLYDLIVNSFKNNCLSEEIMISNPLLQLQIIKGYLEGNNFNFIFENKMLLNQFKMIFYRNSINPTIKDNKLLLKDEIINEIKKACKNNQNFLVNDIVRDNSDYPILINDNYYMRSSVISNEEVNLLPQVVFCLEVENASSFTVSGILTHNCRAFAKSFLSILGMYLRCIFLPHSKLFICAPGKEQGTKIAMEKLTELWDLFPLFQREVLSKNFQTNQVRIVFRNGSIFDIVAAQDAQRGGRRSGGIIDEVRDHDGDSINTIVLPLMNVNRRTESGQLNVKEPHQGQIYITSAGNKNTYAYEKMKELLLNSIIDPRQAFVWGCSYKVPVLAGLIPSTYVTELKLSGTFKEEDFAREYLSYWIGGSENSWIDGETLYKRRIIVNTEFRKNTNIKKVGYNPEQFYIISVDVGRLGCETVVMVFKVLPNTTGFIKKIVNIEVFSENLHFEHQAARIKEMIYAYDPKEVVIDGNGLGVGLLDFMIRYNKHDLTGALYPPIGSINDEDMLEKQPKDCRKLIYVIKANSSLQSQINADTYASLINGKTHFLITEQNAKSKLLSTEKGNKLSPEQRIRILKPYTLTSILIEEIMNMKVKEGNISQSNLVLERVNTSMSKDKFSALQYGLWRIKEYESKYIKQKTSQKRNLAKFIKFSGR